MLHLREKPRAAESPGRRSWIKTPSAPRRGGGFGPQPASREEYRAASVQADPSVPAGTVLLANGFSQAPFQRSRRASEELFSAGARPGVSRLFRCVSSASISIRPAIAV